MQGSNAKGEKKRHNSLNAIDKYEWSLRPSAMAGYLASYYDVDRQKVVVERIVNSDEQIAYLFHVVQEYVT
jgi:hypothetical protein